MATIIARKNGLGTKWDGAGAKEEGDFSKDLMKLPRLSPFAAVVVAG